MTLDGPLSVEEYIALGYEKLHSKLKTMIAQANRMATWFNVDKQLRLLPALMAMKSLVAQPGRRFPKEGQPSFEEECRLLGLSAEQVRQWKHRTATETDIRALLGEEGNKPRSRAIPAPTAEYHKLMMLTKAVLDGDDRKAEKLAQAIAEEYGV